MKFFAAILLCLFFVVAANAALVDVESVAKNNGASFHWFPVQKTFLLESKNDTLKFALGIPFASSHDKSVALKVAPKIEKGKILVDSLDAVSLLKQEALKADSTKLKAAVTVEKKSEKNADLKKPSVVPPKNETAGTREVKTIVIDPGHGGKDSGALGAKSQEKDIVLTVAKLLKKELEKEGFNVKLTREKDVFIELGERANLANKWDGDLFVSLHCNAIDASIERKKQIKGYHVYVLRAPESEEDKAIARRENKVATLYGEKNAKEELSPLEWFKLEARLEKYKQNSYMFTEEMLKALESGKIRRQGLGVGGAGFMVLVGALMPAVLFEIGFISNPDDESYMMSEKGQKDIAERVSKAVKNYKSAVHSYRETLGR